MGSESTRWRRDEDHAPSGVDTSTPSPARIYDYMIGGKDHFAVDRAIGDKLMADNPLVRATMASNRRFLTRAVRYCAQQGVRQFLDIGTGLPTADNVHQVAARHAPGSSVVYTDNDPIVLAHARALLADETTGQGRTVIIDADLREGADLLRRPEVRDVLDLTEPVALLLVAVLHFVADADRPHDLVAALLAELPPGSHLVLTHGTGDVLPQEADEAGRAYRNASERLFLRSGPEIARFFDGVELVEPGLTWTTRWRPDPAVPEDDLPGVYAGVARTAG
ncbi:SAM-dependent methyltransferase [Actinomadura atramentaria]|uniref:SAM-dependent methyltransferase n=1 Tax=Actinomadura atramentaria TaxID=1990 RepID=UPI00036A3CA8|nr:SAM-dependent methyltransferase [Actinomadura atramentaria]